MKFFINLSDYSEDVRLGIIKETADPMIICYAKKSENPKDRGAVALNSFISTAELQDLSCDSSDYVKKCVLMNKKTMGETIDGMLTNDNETPDENLIVNHPNVLRKTLERFVNTHTNNGLCIIAKERLKYM